MKKKTNEILLSIVTVLLSLTMSSCEPNTPSYNSGNSSDERSYCEVVYTNTTSDYCAILFVDGVSIKASNGNDFTLWAGTSYTTRMSELKYPVDLKVELHEISSDNRYYTKVAATFSKEGYRFKIKI